MSGRKRALMAFAPVALGLYAVAATGGLHSGGEEPTAAACSSCDARHQNRPRLVAGRSTEATP
jgi:hypothetical protein